VTVAYAGGAKHNAEGILVEQVNNGKMWIVGKETSGAKGKLYALPAGVATNTGTQTATAVSGLDIREWITDAALSPDGTKMVVRGGNYGSIYNFAAGSANPIPAAEARFRFDTITGVNQSLGEGVTFSADGKSVYINTEFGTGQTSTQLLRIPVSKLPTPN
jgi:hypothetical protein